MVRCRWPKNHNEIIKTDMKKVLDITTNGWSNKDLAMLQKQVESMNYKWRGKAITQDGTIKYFFSHTKVEAAAVCYEQGWKFLEAKPNYLRKNK